MVARATAVARPVAAVAVVRSPPNYGIRPRLARRAALRATPRYIGEVFLGEELLPAHRERELDATVAAGQDLIRAEGEYYR